MLLRPLSSLLLLLVVQLVVSAFVMKRDWPRRPCRSDRENDYCMFAYKRNNAIHTATGLCSCDETTECQLKKRKGERYWYFTCQVPLPLPESIYDDEDDDNHETHDDNNTVQLLRLRQ